MLKLPRRKAQRPEREELRGYRRVLAEKAASGRSNGPENDTGDSPKKPARKRKSSKGGK